MCGKANYMPAELRVVLCNYMAPLNLASIFAVPSDLKRLRFLPVKEVVRSQIDDGIIVKTVADQTIGIYVNHWPKVTGQFRRPVPHAPRGRSKLSCRPICTGFATPPRRLGSIRQIAECSDECYSDAYRTSAKSSCRFCSRAG